LVFESMRFSTAASGTSFTRTQIFKMLLLGLSARSSPLAPRAADVTYPVD
jgi:hypothetical protein